MFLSNPRKHLEKKSQRLFGVSREVVKYHMKNSPY